MSSTTLEPGDYVRDPLEPPGSPLRKVVIIDGTTVHMTDGGVMGLDECTDIFLESEVIDGYSQHRRKGRK